MDWTGTSAQANKSVELAVIKVEATVPVTDASYGGAVVLNPGKRKEQSASLNLADGRILQEDQEAPELHLDIIGFDPRGVNNSRPLIACYPDRLASAAAKIEEDAHGPIDSSDVSFNNMWASKRAQADSCSQRAIENGIGMHMDTAPVARDIVEIFERHGEWREVEAQRLMMSMGSFKDAAAQETAVRTAYRPGEEMVQYWGFSYGSILGATLAAMYPERIKRAVLDGVLDSHDYMTGGWTSNLRDTDLLLARLASYCFDGGPTNCAIYHPDGPAVIIDNIQMTLTHLQSHPISVLDVDGQGPQVVTYSTFSAHIREIVYNPLKFFPTTTQILHDLSQGNGTSLASWKLSLRPDLSIPVPEDCEKDGPYSPSCFTAEDHGHTGALMGILCSDAVPDRLNQSREEYMEYAQKIMAQSRLIGARWAALQIPCTAWKARPHWRYDGNFHNITANPILFAGNTIDPVTPLYNAFLMANGFLGADKKGAGVLHQDSEGHCTYGAVSMCSGRALREYFQSGKLPGEMGGLKEVDEWDGTGKLCEPDRKPLDGYTEDAEIRLPDGETDEEMWEAVVGLNRVWP